MPTTFGMVVLGLLVVGALAGLVLWARQAQHRRSTPPTRSRNGSVPYDENRAAAEQTRASDRNGWM